MDHFIMFLNNLNSFRRLYECINHSTKRCHTTYNRVSFITVGILIKIIYSRKNMLEKNT